jgi:hypothetical protein
MNTSICSAAASSSTDGHARCRTSSIRGRCANLTWTVEDRSYTTLIDGSLPTSS